MIRTFSGAIESLRAETGLEAEALFGDRVLDASEMTPTTAYAFGMIDGAALALGLTSIELADQLEE